MTRLMKVYHFPVEKIKKSTYYDYRYIKKSLNRSKSYKSINKLFEFFLNLKSLETKEIQVHYNVYV